MPSKITNLETMDVWKTKSKFNYDLWAENTTVKLVNVAWDGITDVPFFEDEDDRRTYFVGMDGYEVDKESLLNTVNQAINTQTAKVALPFSQLNFNYLVVLSGQTPVGVNDLPEQRDYFFFIEDAEQISPSVCNLTLRPDLFTTYQFDLAINKAHYKRGHFKTDAISVEQFFGGNRLSSELNTLEEPISAVNRQVGKTKIYHLASGQPYVCIMTAADLLSDGWSNTDGTPTTPYLPETTALGGVMNGTRTYAVKAGDMATLVANVPRQFWNACKGIFYADSSWLYFTNNNTNKWGITIYEISSSDAMTMMLGSVDVSQSDFNYQSTFYKYYTGQFCPIDVYKGNEFLATIGLENFNDLKVGISSNVVYPFIKFEAFLFGINQNGRSSGQMFAFERIDGRQQINIGNDDWRQTVYDFNVPIFAMSEQPLRRWDYEQAANNANTRYNRDIDLQIAKRNATNSKTNSDASTNTAHDNTAASLATALANGLRSNQTALTNATNSAATAQSNTKDSATTGFKNITLQSDFEHDQTYARDEFQNGDEGMAVYQQDNQIRTMDMENNILDDDFNYNKSSGSLEAAAGMGFQGLRQFSVSPHAANVTNASTTANAIAGGSAATQIETTVSSGLTSFAGGILVAGGIALTNWELAQARLQHDYDMAKIRYNTGKAILQSLTTETRTRNSEFNKKWADNAMLNTNIMGENSRDTTIANAERSYNTTTGNANLTKTTSDSNLNDENTTSVANNERTTNTGLANNQRNYDTATADAQDNFNRVDVNINYNREAAGVSPNIEHGTASGDYLTYTTGHYLYQFILRQPDELTAKNVNNMFDQFGYTWDETVNGQDVQHATLVNRNRNFNYWQMDNIVFKPTRIKQSYLTAIKQLFENGVRIWRKEALSD